MNLPYASVKSTMRVAPHQDKLELPQLPVHVLEAMAQVSVDHILAPKGLKRQVRATGEDFANLDKFTILHFVMSILDWYEEHPTTDLTLAIFLEKIEVTNKTTIQELFQDAQIKEPHIRIPQVWNFIPVFYDTVIQGGATHEAWHTTRSAREPLDPQRLVKDFFPKFPKRARMSPVRKHFLKSLWNILEDTMIERQGLVDQPELRPVMCTIHDHIHQLEAQHRGGREVSASEVFLNLLRDVSLGYNIESAQVALREHGRAFPKIVAEFREGGKFQKLLERAQELQDSYQVVQLFLDLWTGTEALAAQSPQRKGQGPSLPGGDTPKGTPKGTPEKGPLGEEGGTSGSKGSGGKKGAKKGGEAQGAKEDAAPGNMEPCSEGGRGLPSKGASGGGALDEGKELPELCEEILDCPQQWYHLTVHQLLQNLLKELRASRVIDPLLPGEARWNPKSIKGDRITLAKKGSYEASQRRLREVQPVVAAIRTQLRTLFVAHRVPTRIEGLRKGKSISSRFLAETVGLLAASEIPRRAFRAELPVTKQDMAVVLCTDESGSMDCVREQLIRTFLALAEGMSSVGQAVFSFGIRSAAAKVDAKDGGTHLEGEPIHRRHAVEYMVYQKWGEPFMVVSQRFDSVRADGSTPLGDGLHFALELLRLRPETHRIVLMLTDGDPDGGHAPVIRYDQRQAQREKIHVVGVGIGVRSGNLQALFPDHVVIPNPDDLARLLMAKLYDLCHDRIAVATTI